MSKCKFCKKNKTVFPIMLNNKKTIICKDCFSKLENVTSIGFEFPTEENPNTRNVVFYVRFLKPELFGNASCARVEYICEPDTDIKVLKQRAKIDFIAKATGTELKEVFKIMKDKNHEKYQEYWNIYDDIEFISEEEYNEC